MNMALTLLTIRLILLVLGLLGIGFILYDIFKKDIIALMKGAYIKKILGVFILCLGIIGLFVPIFPGFIFIFWGLTLLGNITIKKFMNKLNASWRKKIR